MKKNIIIIIFSLLVGLMATFIYTEKSQANEEISTLQISIAEKILRFHVIANSNSLEDQELKLKTKEYLAEYIDKLTQNSASLDDTLTIINGNNESIEKAAKEFIESAGFNYDVKGFVTTAYFPIKTYGDITLPAGDYLAYELIIGEGKGANWWCILYPPLCFVDLSTGIVPEESKTMLQDILDSSEYTLITTGKPEIKEVRFKYLSFLNKFVD